VKFKIKYICGILGSVICAQAFANGTNENSFDDFDIGATLILQREKYSGVLTDSGSSQSSSFLRRADVKIQVPFIAGILFNLKIKTKKNGEVALLDSYAALDLFSGFSIRVGRFDPEFGNELTASTNWTTAIERSAIHDLLLLSGDGSKGEGASLIYSSDLFHGNLSAYKNSNAKYYSSRLVSITAPEKNHRFLFGVSATFTEDLIANDGEINSDLGFWYLDEEPETNLIKFAKSLDDEVISDNRETGLELTYQYHNALLQAEYIRRDYASQDRTTTTLAEGFYVQLAYTLTGESRRFKKSNATFKGIKPKRHDGIVPGAWEVFLRHEGIKAEQETGIGTNDLSSEVRRANVDTIGLNWYYREDLRIASSYSKIYAPADDNDEGQIRGSGMAFRILFSF
jgi:phosphate-selective porin OprO/OprP